MNATDTEGGQQPLESCCLSVKANTKQLHTPPDKPDQTTHELDGIFKPEANTPRTSELGILELETNAFQQMVYRNEVDGALAEAAATNLKAKGAEDGTTPNRAEPISIEQQTMDSPIPEPPSTANTQSIAERKQSDHTQHQPCSTHPPEEADQWTSGTAEELDAIFGSSVVPEDLEEPSEVIAVGYLCFRGVSTDSAAACRTSMQSCIELLIRRQQQSLKL